MPHDPETHNEENSTANYAELHDLSPEQTRSLGAQVLTKVGFETREKQIVDSSFEKARKNQEKLPGKNNERRNYAYLSRLERLIGKYGNEAEKRLWQASIKDDLLVKEEDITEATWKAKEQEHRDNEHGDIELTDRLKHEYAEKWRELQEKSLEKWADYLGDEHSPYPLWFKIYAWDGMTKMGVYNKAKSKYEIRNETTVAPYLNPDAEILGKMFEVISHYHGNGEKELYTEEGERNINLENLVQSGNFPKIYNAIQQGIAPIIEPPEKAEDVHGKWMEYKLGDEEYIAAAAKGTGWCVASSAVGRHYLEHGTYDTNYDHDGEHNENLKSRFILFHLENPDTGRLSRNAVASIRLDSDGKVAEISGLKDGQSLNDSLVQVTEEKVKSLPGGEEFLSKFADKNELIRLDRKMQKGEEFTKEELEFIYEIHRPIKTLDTYNNRDPRIPELKEKYLDKAIEALGINQVVSKLNPNLTAKHLDTLISHGANIDIRQLVSKLKPNIIAKNLDTLISHGADLNQLISDMDPWGINTNLDTLLSHGADMHQIVSGIGPYLTAKNLDTLISHGADIDQIVLKLHPAITADNLDALISRGANIDIHQLVSKLDPYDIAKKLDTLISHGVDIDQLVPRFASDDIADNLDTLISHGADINQLISEMKSLDINRNLGTLLSHGADMNQLISDMSQWDIGGNLDTLLSHGADMGQLVSKLNPHYITDNLDTLISHGADMDQLVSKLDPDIITDNLDTLISHGADINQLISEMKSLDINRNLDTLLSHGANIDIRQLVSKLDPDIITDNLDTLISHGADLSQLISGMKARDIIGNLDTLLSHGADMHQIVSGIGPYLTAKHLDTLISHGANIDIRQLVSKLNPNIIAKNLDTLISHGADLNQLISDMDPWGINTNLDTLLSHGANADELATKIIEGHSSLTMPYIKNSIDILLNHGANPEKIVKTLTANGGYINSQGLPAFY